MCRECTVSRSMMCGCFEFCVFLNSTFVAPPHPRPKEKNKQRFLYTAKNTRFICFKFVQQKSRKKRAGEEISLMYGGASSCQIVVVYQRLLKCHLSTHKREAVNLLLRRTQNWTDHVTAFSRWNLYKLTKHVAGVRVTDVPNQFIPGFGNLIVKSR